MNHTILDNGTEIEVTTTERDRLLEADIIYWCSDCQCYHVSDDRGIEGVEDFLKA